MRRRNQKKKRWKTKRWGGDLRLWCIVARHCAADEETNEKVDENCLLRPFLQADEEGS